MSKKYLITLAAIATLLVSCETEKTTESNVAVEEKIVVIIPSGKEEVTQLLDNIAVAKIEINKTTTSELASIYDIEVNDYYMTKKVDLEDHVLYINFTISKGLLSKISYATLSNSTKDFSYITTLMTQKFGENYAVTYNTKDSLANNASKIWKLDSTSIQYETFSDLNSGYEITIK